MFWLLGWICVGLLVSCTYGETETKEEPGFVSLFNGEGLSGWVEMGESGGFKVENQELVLKQPKNYPAWLRSEKKYGNFILRLEYRIPAWGESGILVHAPLYGRLSRSGLKIHLTHDDQDQGTHSVGAIYGVLAPLARPIRKEGRWNQVEIHFEWPFLRVSFNGQLIQDVNMEWFPDLKLRLRSGYIGLQDLGTGISFRKIRIRELPDGEQWMKIFNGLDLSGWHTEGAAKWEVMDGKIIAKDGNGYLISNESFSAFEFQTYIRTSRHANGGVFYRWISREKRGYEAQIYNVDDATNPTGSIYGVVPAVDPGSKDEEWFLLQIVSDGLYSAVRVNGKTVAESHSLETPDHGKIALQMHKKNAQIEFLEPRLRLLR